MAEQLAGEEPAGTAAGRAQQIQFTGLRFTALLIFTQLPGVLAYTIPLPLLAEMAKDMAHDAASEFLVKLILGAIGPTMAAGALAGGLLADKFDRRWLLIGLAAVYVLSALVPYGLANLEIIVATRIIVGITAGALMAIGLTMVGDYLPEHKRSGTIGMLSALNMVTSLVSMPAAGFVGEAGWRPAFLLYLAMVPLVILASPTPLPAPRKPVAAAPKQSGGKRLRLDMPIGLLVLALAVGVILTIPGIYASFHLASIGLGKTSTVAMLMMGNSLMAAVFSAMFGRALSRFSWKMIFSISFSALGFGLIMFAYAPNIWFAIPALLLMGVGMGWLAPGIPTKAVESVDAGRRGTVVGAVQGAASVAPLIGLTMLEPLTPLIGTPGIMLVVGILSTALFLGYAVSRSDRPSPPSPALH